MTLGVINTSISRFMDSLRGSEQIAHHRHIAQQGDLVFLIGFFHFKDAATDHGAAVF